MKIIAQNSCTNEKLLYLYINKQTIKHTTMNEYWIDSGQTCFKETKEEFYKAINAGFRGFILYPSGKIYHIS